jgi:hypothetical protein
MEVCRSMKPAATSIEPGHLVACHAVEASRDAAA